MPLLTKTNFDTVTTIPVSVPETEIRSGSHVALTTIYLRAGMRLSVRWMGLHVINVDSGLWKVGKYVDTMSESEINALTKESAALDSVFVGAYFSGDKNVPVSGIPLYKVGSDFIGFVAGNPYAPVEFSVPGYYAFAIVNNSIYDNFNVCVSGALRLKMTPDT